jgi:hypothetical protein
VEAVDDLRDLIGRWIMVSKLVSRVVDRMGEGETFGAARVAVTLRRLRDAGGIRAVREGKAPPRGAPVNA